MNNCNSEIKKERWMKAQTQMLFLSFVGVLFNELMFVLALNRS
jgi:hypothetical protein